MIHLCANCEVLRRQVTNLERQMGRDFPKGAMGSVAEHLGLTPNESRLLLTIYYRDDWTASRYIEHHLDMCDSVLKSNVFKMRRKLGHAAIESHWGIGYRLSPAAQLRIGEVLG